MTTGCSPVTKTSYNAARDYETYSSAKGLTTVYGELEQIGMQDNPPFVMQDPPVQSEFRRMVSKGFTPRQVSAVEPMVREFVVERIEALKARGSGDIVVELFKTVAVDGCRTLSGCAGIGP